GGYLAALSRLVPPGSEASPGALPRRPLRGLSRSAAEITVPRPRAGHTDGWSSPPPPEGTGDDDRPPDPVRPADAAVGRGRAARRSARRGPAGALPGRRRRGLRGAGAAARADGAGRLPPRPGRRGRRRGRLPGHLPGAVAARPGDP